MISPPKGAFLMALKRVMFKNPFIKNKFPKLPKFLLFAFLSSKIMKVKYAFGDKYGGF